MKILATLLTALTLSFGGEINWMSYDAALKQSSENPKPLFVEIMSKGCRYCDYMEENVFADTKVQQFLNAHYYSIKLNAREDEIPKGLSVIGTPMLYILEAKSAEVKERVFGALTKEDFLDTLKQHR